MKRQKGNEYFNCITNELDDDTYDLLLYNVNDFLYNYSDHQKGNNSRSKELGFVGTLKGIFLKLIKISFILKNTLLFKERKENTIMSNAYVDVNLYGADIVLPPWAFSLKAEIANSFAMTIIVENIKEELSKRSTKVLMSQEFKMLLSEFENEMLKLFSNYKIKALIFPNDMSFYENLSIKIAKKHSIPSFVYLHGLPARYNSIDDNRAEYLVVWGKGLKNEYIKAGVNEDKILTLKHPIYSNFEKVDLESSLDNILVLSKSIAGSPSSSSELFLPNRTVSLSYLECLKVHLKNLGVNTTKLRLHPSEIKEFYENNLPDDFFVIEESLKEESLSKASLVIGPTSTMILDAIKAGKNYILFDPVFNGLTFEGIPLVEPFTGESFIRLSNSFEEIKDNILNPSINIDFDKLNAFFEVEGKDVLRFYDKTKINNQFNK